MRDINRIDKITNELNRLWKKEPDFRFGQLVHMIYFNSNDHPKGDRDKFYVEDNVWLEVIEKLNNEYKTQTWKNVEKAKRVINDVINKKENE